MASNVLPLFWNLASSSKDARLTASAELITSLESFQEAFQATRPTDISDDEDDHEVEDDDESSNHSEEEGDDDEDDNESGIEVDASDEDDDEDDDGHGAMLDEQLARRNAEDVVYSVKRLVRGLASSRESSRLGFAVALTEVSRISKLLASDPS